MAEPVGESLDTTAGGPIILDRPGSAAYDADRLARIEDAKANPRGSAENHPGFLESSNTSEQEREISQGES